MGDKHETGQWGLMGETFGEEEHLVHGLIGPTVRTLRKLVQLGSSDDYSRRFTPTEEGYAAEFGIRVRAGGDPKVISVLQAVKRIRRNTDETGTNIGNYEQFRWLTICHLDQCPEGKRVVIKAVYTPTSEGAETYELSGVGVGDDLNPGEYLTAEESVKYNFTGVDLPAVSLPHSDIPIQIQTPFLINGEYKILELPCVFTEGMSITETS